MEKISKYRLTHAVIWCKRQDKIWKKAYVCISTLKEPI